eukprot:3971340-Pleurochrysis_carterae.AAC.4
MSQAQILLMLPELQTLVAFTLPSCCLSTFYKCALILNSVASDPAHLYETFPSHEKSGEKASVLEVFRGATFPGPYVLRDECVRLPLNPSNPRARTHLGPDCPVYPGDGRRGNTAGLMPVPVDIVRAQGMERVTLPLV